VFQPFLLEYQEAFSWYQPQGHPLVGPASEEQPPPHQCWKLWRSKIGHKPAGITAKIFADDAEDDSCIFKGALSYWRMSQNLTKTFPAFVCFAASS
jgi:hypothetical protein